MDPRHGVCAACGAQFKIPASFHHDQARCSACGGTVEITPKAQASASPPAREAASRPSGAAPAVPARKPAAREPGGASQAKKKRSGPSMKEQLLARRAQQAEGASAGKPAGQTAPQARAGKAAPQARAARPAARSGEKPAAQPAPKPAAQGARPSGAAKRAAKPAPAAGRTRTPAAEGPGKGRPARATAAAGAGRAGGRSRRRGGDGDGDGEGGSSRHARHAHHHPKPSVVPTLVAVVLVVVAAGGTWWYLQSDSPVNAEGPATAEAPAVEAPAGEGSADEAASADAAQTADDAAEGADETAPAEGTEPEVADADADPDEAGGAEDSGPSVDPDSVDLMALPEFGPAEGSSQEEFESLTADVAEAIDPYAGAAGTRARVRLEEAGKAAFPVILNAMKRIDYATEQGRKDGDLLQKTLMTIVDGRNFGWKYTTDPKDVLFNKQVVVAWANQWEKVVENDEYWEAFAKKKGAASTEEAKPDDGAGLDLGGLDDLGG